MRERVKQALDQLQSAKRSGSGVTSVDIDMVESALQQALAEDDGAKQAGQAAPQAASPARRAGGGPDGLAEN